MLELRDCKVYDRWLWSASSKPKSLKFDTCNQFGKKKKKPERKKERKRIIYFRLCISKSDNKSQIKPCHFDIQLISLWILEDCEHLHHGLRLSNSTNVERHNSSGRGTKIDHGNWSRYKETQELAVTPKRYTCWQWLAERPNWGWEAGKLKLDALCEQNWRVKYVLINA